LKSSWKKKVNVEFRAELKINEPNQTKPSSAQLDSFPTLLPMNPSSSCLLCLPLHCAFYWCVSNNFSTVSSFRQSSIVFFIPAMSFIPFFNCLYNSGILKSMLFFRFWSPSLFISPACFRQFYNIHVLFLTILSHALYLCHLLLWFVLVLWPQSYYSGQRYEFGLWHS